MTDKTQQIRNWPDILDKTCAMVGAALPVGLVAGSTAFEIIIGMVVLGWALDLHQGTRRIILTSMALN